ncbi:hypothetical protein A2W24_04610 [Microgenomates group bacterium RBG_16_45_19]|nr:MAG: hypothetical protein A2W24_04610 [Microgenomates group bacterium RBG_16_45_19]
MSATILQTSLAFSALIKLDRLPQWLHQPSLDHLIIDIEGILGLPISRQVQAFLVRPPLTRSIKVVVINQAHQLTPIAQTALLKLLEEPPFYAHLFLITPEVHRLLPTVVSRCHIQVIQAVPPELQTNPLTTVLESLPPQAEPWLRFKISQTLKLNRPALLHQLLGLLYHCSQELSQHPTEVRLKQSTLGLHTWSAVNRNANLALSLEHLFLHW